MKKNILEEIPDENIEFAFLYLKQNFNIRKQNHK